MRLLYLSPAAALGGAERVLLDLLGLLRCHRPSWTLGLVVCDAGPLPDAARTLGVHVTVLPFPDRVARMGESPRPAVSAGFTPWVRPAARAAAAAPAAAAYLRSLRAAVAAFAPDLVHSNGLKMHLLGACAVRHGTPLLWHVHDYVSQRPLARRAMRLARGRCRAAIAVSESIATDVREALGPGIAVRAVRNSVDLERFSPDGERLDLDARAGMPPAGAGEIRIGMVGTLARWKGHETFLRALRALADRGCAFRAYVVGGAIYRTDDSQCSISDLRGEAARLGLSDRVGFIGFLPDVAPVYRALDVVVHASTQPEPFGLVIAEGMACGRPVVVSLAGGAAELVQPGQDALTFAPGRADELAGQLGRLRESPALRNDLAARARAAAVARFDPARFVSEILDVYGDASAATAA
ncbi:MAG: glycosyltransferase family 4 protein [Vicinamibacterales bacterium]